MTRTQRRTKIKSGFILAAAVIFLIALFAISFAFARGGTAIAEDYESLTYVTINTGHVTTYMGYTDLEKASCAPLDGVVDNEYEFCYVFLSPVGGNYTLGANYKITATNWTSNLPALETGCNLNGAGKTIWNSADAGNVSASGSICGGLASGCDGIVENLTYVFTGSFSVKKHSSSDSIAAGGMFGKTFASSNIKNCKLVSTGSIDTESDAEGVTSYVGGLIGLNQGNLTGTSANVSASVEAYTDKETKSSNAKHNIIYAGGAIGKHYSGSISSCNMKSTATVIAADNTDKWTNDTGGIIDSVFDWFSDNLIDLDELPFGIGDYAESTVKAVFGSSYNDKEHVHPAGVMLGCIGGSGSVKNSVIEVGGGAVSYGMPGSSNTGSIAGGFVGLLETDCNGAILQSNKFKLNGSMSSFVLPGLDLTDQIVDLISSWFYTRNIEAYNGALIGKCSAENFSFRNNFILVDTDNGIIDNGADYESKTYTSMSGLLCGNTDFGTKVGANNWLARKLSNCDTGRIVGNTVNAESLNYLNIFGDGEVYMDGYITNDSSYTVKVKGLCSPFYGWTDDITNPSGFGTNRSRTLSASNGAVLFAVFIDTEIESSGELTQLANDINQIEKKVWKNIGEQNDEHRMYFGGLGKTTLSWLHVKLTKDILVQKGTPVIENFYGTFDGLGHSISFAAGSKITHDVEQEEEKPEEGSEESYNYKERNTGLFGTIRLGATVKSVDILFGGVISDTSGIEYNSLEKKIDDEDYSTSELIAREKINATGAENGVKTRTMAYSEFVYPDSATLSAFDNVFVYFFTGTGYDASREGNPGYVEIVPYLANIIVKTHNVGILAGKNCGTVENVNVDATKSASIACTANYVNFGALCGSNEGTVKNSTVAFRGKAALTARGAANAGGMFGVYTPYAGAQASGLSSFVGGEIDIKKGDNYHLVKIYEYTEAIVVEGNGSSSIELPDGYDQIAREYQPTQGAPVDTYFFGVKGKMAVKTYKIRGNETTLDTLETIGTLIGNYNGAASNFSNVVAVSGTKGSYNTVIYQPDSEDAYVGALIGYVQAHAESISFANTWAGMSYEEFDKGADGRLAIGSSTYGTKNKINLIYVQTAIVIPKLNTSSTAALPISFSLEERENMTFSGWYDYTTGVRTVITEGLEGFTFTPQTQAGAEDYVYVAELIELQLMTEAQMDKLSASTNEGRGYRDVTFTLGTDITLTDFTPIGTVEHPFLGTLDGCGQQVELTGMKSTALLGLFGCLGEEGGDVGIVKNITVYVSSNLGNDTQTTKAGAVAAVNYGTIGQDSSTGKVYVRIKGKITAATVGGVAGENYGEIKNVEVTYVYQSNIYHGQLIAGSQGTAPVIAGGAIAVNGGDSSSQKGVAKNIILYFEGKPGTIAIGSTKTKYMLGGVIGVNGEFGEAYSLVAVVGDDKVVNGSAGSDNGDSRYRALLIGNNESSKVDSLWVLYLSRGSNNEDPNEPKLGAPVSIYNGSDNVIGNKAVLLNGESAYVGNALIKYGRGNVAVTISSADRGKGGQITFHSSGLDGVAFYDYVADFYSGSRVSVSEGNTGYAFSPTVGETGKNGLLGKVYYAGFANTSIATQSDYIALQQNIAADYRLYVEYNVTNSFTLDALTATNAIGTEEKPFRGSINGNAYTVTMNSLSMHAFVGVLGEPSDKNHYSTIKNFRLAVQPGAKIEETGEDVASGFLTDVNYGTISGLNITVRGCILNRNGSAGSVAGVNYGVISSAILVMEYANYVGKEGYGVIVAKNAGALVGVNYGTIGSDVANAIDITIKKGTSYGGVLYGTEYVGAVAGVNECVIEEDEEGDPLRIPGVIRSAFVSISGTVVGKNASALVGYNKGDVQDALVTLQKNATYFGTETFGLIAALNEGKIGVSKSDRNATIKAYLYAIPTYGAGVNVYDGVITDAAATKIIGGAVGVNEASGEIKALLVELHDSLISSLKAGGIAGENKGSIEQTSLSGRKGANVISLTAGGIVGENSGTLSTLQATLRGDVGSAQAGENGILLSAYAGGFAGVNTRVAEDVDDNGIRHSVLSLYGDVYGTNAGLACGQTQANFAYNTWIQICNSSKTAVIGDSEGRAGFNVIRVLNETLLEVTFDYSYNSFSFVSSIPADTNVMEWYTDISGWTSNSGIMKEADGLRSKTEYLPDSETKNLICYLCYDKLTIKTTADFLSLATKVNSKSYYDNVLFRLGSNITVPSGTVARPIGTEDHPFNGIFDGGYYKITFRSGSAISGTEYTGVFGYTGPNSRIANFLLNIEKKVTIGSVNSYEVAALVGHNEGYLQNVFVNLSSKITANSGARYVGTLVGKYVAAERRANDAANCWISVLNGDAPVVGNLSGNDAFGANAIGVLGNGATEVNFLKKYTAGTNEEIQAVYSVPVNSADSETYFTNFDGWFYDNGNGSKIKVQGDTDGSFEKTINVLGDFTFYNTEEKWDASLTVDPSEDNRNRKITLSFIPLIIGDEADFILFANNVNTYGDQGATFTLTKNIRVDFTKCASVGTADHPFTGVFNGNGFTIDVVGSMLKREYAGVFGYVGVGGVVRNLIVNVKTNDQKEEVKIGDNSTLYSGTAVALLFGKIENVVVRLRAGTVVYTTQGLASSGGIVGRAGKYVDGTVANDVSYEIDNCWLILEEGATVTNPVGEDPDLSHNDYYRTHKESCGKGYKMQIVGEGTLDIEVRLRNENEPAEGYEIHFDASKNTSVFYGFIDNKDMDSDVVSEIHDGVGDTYSTKFWTVRPGGKDLNDDVVSDDMLCVIINRYIDDIYGLMRVSDDVAKGRSYRGITYILRANIEIPLEWDPNPPSEEEEETEEQTEPVLVPFVFSPIGGEVTLSGGNGYSNYVERDFVGGFDGGGFTITFPEGITIKDRYAGLFGRVGETARIYNLTVEANCKIGYDSGENTTRTLYAGVLAAYAAGGKYSNNIVVMNKRASLYGSLGTGRTFGYLPRESGDVATNCWVISFNSKENYDLNAAELLYNAAFDKEAFLASGTAPTVGSNQGGVNNLMVVAAGDVQYVRQEGSNLWKYHFTYTGTSYWYLLNEFTGDKAAAIGAAGGSFHPDENATRLGYNVSFLNSEIRTVEDLNAYAENINDGYNFYKLTFTLEEDILIGESDGFVSIGYEGSGLNGTFDGQGHTITVDKKTVIAGNYAGVFGYVAAEGTVKNLRIVVRGRLGNAVTTAYAGAVAYNNGNLENLIVVSEEAVLLTSNGYAGIVVGYDATNLVKNVWALVDASSFVESVGRVAVGDSGVNTMKIIGIGKIKASFAGEGDYRVKFSLDENSVASISGWYKSFAKNQQISSAMLTGGALYSDEINGYYLIAPVGLFGVEYEVAAIKTTIEQVNELVAVAEDVNIGGYNFENVTFVLGKDLIITIDYLSIGTAAHPFKGILTGRFVNELSEVSYHTITIANPFNQKIDALFAYNSGTISDLTVIVKGTIGDGTNDQDQIYGAVAAFNNGTIERVYVEIVKDEEVHGKILGYTVGAVAGRNNGTIRDCVVVIKGTVQAESAAGNTLNAGGMVGINYGAVEGTPDFSYWTTERKCLPTATRMVKNGLSGYIEQSYYVESNVFVYGTVLARSNAQSAYANAGGVIGNHYGGSADYLIAYLEGGIVKAEAHAEQGARAGGLVGYAHAALNHSVLFLYGEVSAEQIETELEEQLVLKGGTAGYLDGVIAMNVWQVTLNDIVEPAGKGSKSINKLNIKGNGKLKASIDTFTKSVMFTNITDDNGSEINGWYTAATVEVDNKTGNIGENGNTFIPLVGIQNKYVMVIFVNTEITSVADLRDMASSVSGGLSGEEIVFTLKADLTVKAGDLPVTIGSEAYPFNNVFDGKGHTITFEAGALPGSDYVALFGYTGASSVIKNLKLVVSAGSYGSEKSERTAVLVAYHEGTIKGETDAEIDPKVVITIAKHALLTGHTVGAVAATSFGKIYDVDLTLAGTMNAKGNKNTDAAGGLVGVNDGEIAGATIDTTADAHFLAEEGATAYAGVIAAENYKTVADVSVLYSGKLTVKGSMTAYSGVAAGLNLGSVDRVYVKISGGSFGEGGSGGLVGNNVNVLSTSFVEIIGEEFAGTDSAVAHFKEKNDGKQYIYNVWVYSDNVKNLSAVRGVNAMFFDAIDGPAFASVPSSEDVRAGKITFSADISDVKSSVYLFANVLDDGDYAVGSGAATDNVEYEAGKMNFVTYDMVAEQAVARKIAGIRVHLVSRTEIGSGTEFHAFAAAVNSERYAFESTTFTLTADFTLPERTFPAINLPAALTLEGGHHVVTVGDATLPIGLFAVNFGAINDIGLRLTKAETASLVATNNGSLQRAVVYLERGADVLGGKFFVTENNGTASDLWLVVREEKALPIDADYAIILINGVGSLTQGGENGALIFTASTAAEEGMIFVGYTEDGALYGEYSVLFNTAAKAKKIYTAEFISTYLDTDYKLQVLSDVAALGYTGNTTFTLGADLTATANLFAVAKEGKLFVGVIEGAGHRITAAVGVTDLFGKFAGELHNVVIDLSRLSATEGKMFSGTQTVVMANVVVVEEREGLFFGEVNAQATNVWIQSGNATLKDGFAGDKYSLLYANGNVAYTFENGKVYAVAEDSELQVFAGYFGAMGALAGKEKSYELTAGAKVITLNYINRILSSTDDLLRLATAVGGSFDFEGVTFRVKNGGFAVDRAIGTIGDETHPFKGNIKGGVLSEILFENYTVEETFAVAPLLNRLYGEMTDLIFRYKEGAFFTGAATLVKTNSGLMHAVVVVSEGDSLFADGAALTLVNGGEIVNSWLVTYGTERAVAEGDLVGANELRTDKNVNLAVSFNSGVQGTRVQFAVDPIIGYYACLYNYDGEVVFPGNYNTASGLYTAPATSSGVKLAVKGRNEIAAEEELVYLGYLTANGNLEAGSIVTLTKDLTVNAHLSAILLDELIIDLAGHKLVLAATTATDEALFAKVGTAGTVKNGSLYLSKGHYAIGSAGLNLDNVTLFLLDDAMTLPNYALGENVTVVTSDKTHKTSLTTASGSYSFLFSPKGAALSAVYKNDGSVEYAGADNELYYFGDIDSSALDQVALFAPVTLHTAADYEAFLLAANAHPTNLAHAEIALLADLAVDGTTAPNGLIYAGKLLANGHTVTITGGSYSTAYLTVKEGGSVLDLALAFKGATIDVGISLISCAAEDNRVALVVYQAGEARQEETSARVVNVYGGSGILSVSFDGKGGISFTATERDNYAIYKWTNAASEVVNGTAGNAKTVYDGTDPVSAYFELRYLVKVEFSGVSEEVLKKNADHLPTFKGTGIRFAKDLEGAGASFNLEVEIENIGEGFLFCGMTYLGAPLLADGSNPWKYPLVGTKGIYEITLTAALRYIDMSWESVTYSASSFAGAQLAEERALAESIYGVSAVSYEYTPLGATPNLVVGAPYHAGNYLVTFRVTVTVDLGGGDIRSYPMCYAYCGLEIKPKTLSFESLSVKNKVYDGTSDAEVEKDGEGKDKLILSGFVNDQDKAHIALTGLRFSFAVYDKVRGKYVADANAEQSKYIIVDGTGSLAYDATNDPTGNYRYAYLDYTFLESSISSINEGSVRANIERATLKLSVSSVFKTYLEQFESSEAITPVVVSGLLEKDRDLYNSVAAGLLTREKADCYDVGNYRIIVKDSLELPNYNVLLTGEEAYYIVTPSLIKVVFDEDEMTYGDKEHVPAYHVFVGEEKGKVYSALHAGDKLVFSEVVYNEGGALLPSDTTRYSFTCLFSAENKNYKVDADLGYKIVNGVPMAILKGNETLKVNRKEIYVVGDKANTKRVGRRTETIYSSLASGYSFAEEGHVLVATRAAGEAAGNYLISYVVKDATGANVSDRYDIKTDKDYFFTITKATLRIKPSKTAVVYGETVSSIKYGVTVEGGGITLSDLYFAMFGTEKSKVTLEDLGINAFVGYTGEGVLGVGEYNAGMILRSMNETAENSIEDVKLSDAQGMIIVKPRELTVTIGDLTKSYDGLKDFNESKVKFKTTGLLASDEKDKNVEVKKKSYSLIGDGISVGMYKIDGTFTLESKNGTTAAENYYVKVVPGVLTVNPSAVSIKAEVGYFDKDGNFTLASITRSGSAVEDTIYYGDSKAVLRFTLASGGAFLNVPNGTDKEVSDYLASALKISYNRLNKLAPFVEDKTNKPADYVGLSSANNNVKVTYSLALTIAKVHLTIKVISPTKVAGEPDPEIGYKITAQDPADDYKEIKNYSELSEGTFTVTITGERSQGESLGSYSYKNVTVDIVNNYSGESLFDTTSATGKALDGLVEKGKTNNVTLSIKGESFLNTTVGKWVVYGGVLLVIAVLTVLAIIFVPRLIKKKRAKKSPTDPNGPKGEEGEAAEGESSTEEQGAEGAEAPSEEPADAATTTEEQISEEGATEQTPSDAEEAPAEAEPAPSEQTENEKE